MTALNKALNQLSVGFNATIQIQNEVQSLKDVNAAAFSSTFGLSLNSVNGGVTALTQSVDDIIPGFNQNIPTVIDNSQIVNVVQFDGKVDGLSRKLVPGIGSSTAADLALITGSSTSSTSAPLNVVISSGAPEAISAGLKQAGNKTNVTLGTQDFNRVYNNLHKTPVSFTLNLSKTIQQINSNVFQGISTTGLLKNSVSSAISINITAVLNKVSFGFAGVISNAYEQVGGNISGQLQSIVGREIPANEKRITISLIEQGDLFGAASVLQKLNPQLNVNFLAGQLQTIDTSLASQVNRPTLTTEPLRARTISQGKTGETVSSKFAYIFTEEELIVDLKSIERDVTELVTHWTETRIDQNLAAEDIDLFARQAGTVIPYHYIIRRNGTLQRGLNIETIGGSLANGHEQYSIQIAFVGGINTSSVLDATKRQYKSKESLTPDQMKTFSTFLRILYESFPGIQVLGHNNIDKTQIDPGFDVPSYTLSKFGKKTIFEDPSLRGPFTVEELLSQTNAGDAEAQ